MVVLFERLRQKAKEETKDASVSAQDILPIALASHPSDAQRIAFFTDWQP
jgi:hypothetical protein